MTELLGFLFVILGIFSLLNQHLIGFLILIFGCWMLLAAHEWSKKE